VAKSAEATSLLLKNYIVDRLETVIDQGDQVTHVQLAEDIDRVIGDEKAMRKKVKLPDNVRLAPRWHAPPRSLDARAYPVRRPSAVVPPTRLRSTRWTLATCPSSSRAACTT